MLTPLYLGLMLYVMARAGFREPVKWFFFACVLLVSTSFIRDIALFPAYCRSGVSLSQARDEFQGVFQQYPSDTTFYVTGSLWTLTEDYERIREIGAEPETFKGEAFHHSILLLQQNFFDGTKPPATFGDFQLKTYVLSPDVPQIAGIRLAARVPGYGFAVYEHTGG